MQNWRSLHVPFLDTEIKNRVRLLPSCSVSGRRWGCLEAVLDNFSIEGPAADFEHRGRLFLVPTDAVEDARDVGPLGVRQGWQPLVRRFSRRFRGVQELDVLRPDHAAG